MILRYLWVLFLSIALICGWSWVGWCLLATLLVSVIINCVGEIYEHP